MTTTKRANKGGEKVLRGGLESGNAVRRQRRRIPKRILQIMATCCSSEWARDVEHGRTEYPFAGMVLSGACVATGGLSNPKGTVGTRRFTPAAVVGVEDRLDGMGAKAAEHYYHPSAIRYDHARRVREIEHGWGQIEAIVDLGDNRPGTRCVKIADWPFRRISVKVRRAGRVIAKEVCHAFPPELMVVAIVA